MIQSDVFSHLFSSLFWLQNELFIYTWEFGVFLFLTPNSIAIPFINHCIINMMVDNHLIQKNKSWRQGVLFGQTNLNMPTVYHSQ